MIMDTNFVKKIELNIELDMMGQYHLEHPNKITEELFFRMKKLILKMMDLL